MSTVMPHSDYVLFRLHDLLVIHVIHLPVDCPGASKMKNIINS